MTQLPIYSPFLVPDWSVPAWIQACMTLRTLDLDLRATPRPLLKPLLPILPAEPVWLQQVHGIQAVRAEPAAAGQEADAAFTDIPGQVCAILTADCLPVLLCDTERKQIAAIHAGWRGLAAGILPGTLQRGGFQPSTTVAWLGPAIGPLAFEVGNEVRERFLAGWPTAGSAFQPAGADHWLASLYALASLQLQSEGVKSIHGGNYCTVRDNHLFFSFRREKEHAGRMATLIWMT